MGHVSVTNFLSRSYRVSMDEELDLGGIDAAESIYERICIAS